MVYSAAEEILGIDCFNSFLLVEGSRYILLLYIQVFLSMRGCFQETKTKFLYNKKLKSPKNVTRFTVISYLNTFYIPHPAENIDLHN